MKICPPNQRTEGNRKEKNCVPTGSVRGKGARKRRQQTELWKGLELRDVKPSISYQPIDKQK